jgi:hypothetical protein
MGATPKPLLLRSLPKLAAVIPFPMELTTPPVTKMYFVLISTFPSLGYRLLPQS